MSELMRATFALETNNDLIHIIPSGPVVVARDKRLFQITDPARAIAASQMPMLIDWEHKSEMWGGSTEAAGWINSLELRSTGTWARVEWTPRGEQDVRSGAYRFLSPVLELDAETREVLSIVSVALTNKPALSMSAVGDVSAYRERVRIACSLRLQSQIEALGFKKKDLEHLRRRGLSDEQIIAAHRLSRLTDGMSADEYDVAFNSNSQRG